MVNIFSEWVRSITIILLLAFFLDMLIPNSSLKRYVSLVIGLFIVMIILSPLVKFLDAESYGNISVFSSEQRKFNNKMDSLEEIIENGKQIQAVGTEEAKNFLESKLAFQIEGLCSVVDNIEKVKAEINLEPEVKPGELEKIANIFLEVTLKNSDQNESKEGIIEPVIIIGKEDNKKPELEKGGNSEQEKKDVETKLKSILSSFYGIPSDRIKIVFSK